MTTFGTLEYAIDKYSGSWTWKITGVRAVMMILVFGPPRAFQAVDAEGAIIL